MSYEITNYRDACKYLDDMQMHKIKLGLDAVRSILAELGSPERKCPAVHVAGTNGKGSVCSMLQSVITKAGYRTGLYTSPHLSSVRERFRIDDDFISEDEFTYHMERIRLSLGGESITYFECATALAFSWFADNECDLVIIETGMGGRLDATNVLTPLLSVITTISIDHEQYLGDTVEAVAFEKAGIIKQGIPVISGVRDKNAITVIEKTCFGRGSSLINIGADFSMESEDTVAWRWQNSDGSVIITEIPIKKSGGWQVDNTASTIGAAVYLRDCGYHVSDMDIRLGLSATNWPGRMEFLETSCKEKKLKFLLDGAHNSAGVEFLVDTLENRIDYEKLYLVWASMADKTYDIMLRKVALTADHIMLTRPDSERSAAPADLRKVLEGEIGLERVSCIETVEEALEQICSCAKVDDLVVVAGSLYLIGEFRRLLVGEVVG